VSKILIVDDQLDAARLLIALLRLDGFEAERLDRDWENLVSEIEQREPDLVILDVRLPETSGLELLHRVRAHPNARVAGVPVLLTSALDHRYEGELAGADGFILKPYTRQMLLDAIHKIEKKRGWLRGGESGSDEVAPKMEGG
jgi:DNA-binding response OmpR family regulator